MTNWKHSFSLFSLSLNARSNSCVRQKISWKLFPSFAFLMQRIGPPSISLPGKYCTLYCGSWEMDLCIELIKYEGSYGRRLGRALRGLYWKCKKFVGLMGSSVCQSLYVGDVLLSFHSGFSFCSETFSFVLTGEDGSRRFGYCRRLLVIIPTSSSSRRGATFWGVAVTATYCGK